MSKKLLVGAERVRDRAAHPKKIGGSADCAYLRGAFLGLPST